MQRWKTSKKHDLSQSYGYKEKQSSIRKILEYDTVSVVLDNLTSENVYEYCILKKQHWFNAALNAFNTLGKEHFSTEIYKKLLILKLFDTTNAVLIDTVAVKAILNEIQDNNSDALINFYTKEVRNAVGLVDFISSVSPVADINVNDIMYFAVTNSNIETINMYMDLKLIQNWGYIIKKIEPNNEETETFKAFAVIFSILSCLNIFDTPQDIQDILQRADAQLLSMKNQELQLEVIKILFTLLFLRKEHLQIYNNQEGFTNEAKQTSTILHFLKSVFENYQI